MKLVRAVLGSFFGLSFTVSAMAEVPPYVVIPPIVNGQPNPSYGGSDVLLALHVPLLHLDLKSFTMIFDKYVVNAQGSSSIDRKIVKF